MREKFAEEVERGRELRGAFGTAPGERRGAFRLRSPLGARLLVMVSDGADWGDLGLPGEPWEHVSASTPNRCPTWEEMAWVKGLFFGPEECVVQFHVPERQHVNEHPYCLHLWRPTGGPIPLPPADCV